MSKIPASLLHPRTLEALVYCWIPVPQETQVLQDWCQEHGILWRDMHRVHMLCESQYRPVVDAWVAHINLQAVWGNVTIPKFVMTFLHHVAQYLPPVPEVPAGPESTVPVVTLP